MNHKYHNTNMYIIHDSLNILNYLIIIIYLWIMFMLMKVYYPNLYHIIEIII